IVLIAATLRSPITSVGPLIPFFREELEASNSMIGLVNTLPLLAFGIFSPFVPKLSSTVGMERTLLMVMVLLSIGVFMSCLGDIGVLLFGTLLVGIVIAVGNVLMPGLIKSTFPYRVGLMTGFYSVSMNIFGALASGISVPISSIPSLDWGHAIQVCSIFLFMSFVVVLLRLPV